MDGWMMDKEQSGLDNAWFNMSLSISEQVSLYIVMECMHSLSYVSLYCFTKASYTIKILHSRLTI